MHGSCFAGECVSELEALAAYFEAAFATSQAG
jgi:hypothetical protein